jgi:hypothetical protein
MKWGYYLELKSEADQLVEVTRSRFPAREEVTASRSQIGEDKAHSAALLYNFYIFVFLQISNLKNNRSQHNYLFFVSSNVSRMKSIF